jgi:peroxiredoxin family protein
MPCIARFERAHSYRARSASKKGTWPLLPSSLTRKRSGDYSQIPVEIAKFMWARGNEGVMTIAQMDPAVTLANLQTSKTDRVTIVLLSGDMDRAMAAFIIATGAAAMGMKVTVFFTFWGLNAIRRKGAASSAKDWLRQMFGMLNKGGADSLPLSRFHFWGLGTKMMQKVMQQNRMPGVPELMETALDLGVHFIACTTTMGLMGITKDTLIDGIDQFAGVTTYLAEAKQGSVNLFI